MSSEAVPAPATGLRHVLPDLGRDQEQDHGAGRVRPSGSSLNGCEDGSNGPINGDDDLLFEREWLWLWWVS